MIRFFMIRFCNAGLAYRTRLVRHVLHYSHGCRVEQTDQAFFAAVWAAFHQHRKEFRLLSDGFSLKIGIESERELKHDLEQRVAGFFRCKKYDTQLSSLMLYNDRVQYGKTTRRR